MVVPALIVGALLGDWVGGQLFPAPSGSTADSPAVAGPGLQGEVPAVPPPIALLSAPAPTPGDALSPAQGQPPLGSPATGNPGATTKNPGPVQPPPGGNTATAPPPPGWGSRLDTSIQVTGGGQQLGRVQGWFQMHSDRRTFRYSFTFCRQSSYMLPYLEVSVNGQSTLITTIRPSYSGGPLAQPCYGSTETVSNEHSYPSIQNVYFKLYGSTFLNGNEHTIFTQDRTYYNSN